MKKTNLLLLSLAIRLNASSAFSSRSFFLSSATFSFDLRFSSFFSFSLFTSSLLRNNYNLKDLTIKYTFDHPGRPAIHVKNSSILLFSMSTAKVTVI